MMTGRRLMNALVGSDLAGRAGDGQAGQGRRAD
jgi:hypothetical protein